MNKLLGEHIYGKTITDIFSEEDYISCAYLNKLQKLMLGLTTGISYGEIRLITMIQVPSVEGNMTRHVSINLAKIRFVFGRDW